MPGSVASGTLCIFDKIFSPENRAVYKIMWKNKVQPGTDDNMAHAHCKLDTQGYKRTLRICNIYCFSTATPRLNVTLCVH